MKTHFLIPVLLAAVGTGWLLFQGSEIRSLENQNSHLSEQISTRTSRPGSPASDPTTNPRGANSSQEKAKGRIDWKSIGSKFADSVDGTFDDVHAQLRLQQQLQAMTADELVQAISEIQALDLPEQPRSMLEQWVAGALVLKDPQLALETFSARISEPQGMWSWTLANALKGWARKDPAAAAAWFDKQAGDGLLVTKSLDGRNSARTNFEGSLLSTLITRDPAEVSRRLMELPEEQRAETLRHHEFAGLKENDHKTYADLVRRSLPEKEHAVTLSGPAARLVSDGYDNVSAYLDRINATPTERALATERAAEDRINTLSFRQKLSATEVDEMRVWAENQAPGSSDKITGKSLSRTIQYNDAASFKRAADLVLQYHAKGSGDDLIVHFLEDQHGGTNTGAIHDLAEKITDPERRETILKKFPLSR